MLRVTNTMPPPPAIIKKQPRWFRWTISFFKWLLPKCMQFGLFLTKHPSWAKLVYAILYPFALITSPFTEELAAVITLKALDKRDKKSPPLTLKEGHSIVANYMKITQLLAHHRLIKSISKSHAEKLLKKRVRVFHERFLSDQIALNMFWGSLKKKSPQLECSKKRAARKSKLGGAHELL